MGEMNKSFIPNPGSKEAIDFGCKCPVLDNAHGKGYLGIEGVFVFNESCPLHHPNPKLEDLKDTQQE